MEGNIRQSSAFHFHIASLKLVILVHELHRVEILSGRILTPRIWCRDGQIDAKPMCDGGEVVLRQSGKNGSRNRGEVECAAGSEALWVDRGERGTRRGSVSDGLWREDFRYPSKVSILIGQKGSISRQRRAKQRSEVAGRESSITLLVT